MGSTSSKAARTFPKSAKPPPTWAGARTPGPTDPPPLRTEPPLARSAEGPRLASETRTEAIERDAQDPQFLANLGRLGQVKVDHHMSTFSPPVNPARHVYETRLQSEREASSSHSTHNRMLATSLYDLLEELKYAAKFREDVELLAKRYDIDVEKLRGLVRFVNTPTVDPSSVARKLTEDGEETTMKVIWKDAPALTLR